MTTLTSVMPRFYTQEEGIVIDPDEPRRVAMVAPFGSSPVNGVLTVAVALAAALSGRAFEIELWQPHPWPDVEGFRALSTRLDDAGVRRVVLGAGPGRAVLGREAVAAAVAREVDLVHLHGAFSPHVTQLARALSAPYVLSGHGAYAGRALRRSRVRKRLYLASVERATLRRARTVFALTEDEAAAVHALRVDAPVVVVPNGVDPPPSVSAGAFRTELGLSPGVPLAVFAGRLDLHHKGLDRLVTALRDVPEWHLALVGPDERGDERALRGLARDVGVRDRLVFAGPRAGVGLHEALAAAQLFVLPSRWEGQPLALLEALSHGVPALVSHEVERALPIAAAAAGWAADAGDLAATWRSLTDVPAPQWRERRAAARALAARYRWPAVAEGYAEAYRRILESSSTRPAPDGARPAHLDQV